MNNIFMPKLTKLEVRLLSDIPNVEKEPRIYEGTYDAATVATLKRLARRGLIQMFKQEYINIPNLRHTKKTALYMQRYGYQKDGAR